MQYITAQGIKELLEKIYFRPAEGQTFPDFYLSEDDTSNLCEMKTFYKAPNFDVANYYGYVDSLIEKR